MYLALSVHLEQQGVLAIKRKGQGATERRAAPLYEGYPRPPSIYQAGWPWARPKEFEVLKRVGLSWEANLRWLLAFAEEELDRVPSARLGECGHEIISFILSRGMVPSSLEGLEPRGIQRILKEGLAALGPRGRFELRFKITRGVARTKEGAIVPVGRGDLKATFFSAVFDALERAGSRLRTCQNPSCARLFLAARRQEYCGPRCSQAIRTARFRQAHPEKVRAWRREQYARAQRRKYGPKVKVSSRPRKRTEKGGR